MMAYFLVAIVCWWKWLLEVVKILSLIAIGKNIISDGNITIDNAVANSPNDRNITIDNTVANKDY